MLYPIPDEIDGIPTGDPWDSSVHHRYLFDIINDVRYCQQDVCSLCTGLDECILDAWRYTPDIEIDEEVWLDSGQIMTTKGDWV